MQKKQCGMSRKFNWLLVGAALLVSVMGTFSAAPVKAAGPCLLSERVCSSEGIVLIARHADRLVHWRRDTNFFPILLASNKIDPWSLLYSLGPKQTVTLLVGRKDLRSHQIKRLAEAVFARGGSVILTSATLWAAERLERMIGAHGMSWDDATVTAHLYGLREAIGEFGKRNPMVYVLHSDPSGYSHELTQSERAWLLTRIGRNPPVLTRSVNAFALEDSQCSNDPQGCINNLAQAQHTSVKNSANGDGIELDNFIYSARSFINNQDYYYVDQQLQLQICDKNVLIPVAIASVNNFPKENMVISIISPSPGTTENTTTVTSGIDFGISRKAGYTTGSPDGESSFDVAPSLSYSNSKTTTVPPFNISNKTDLTTGNAEWGFEATPDADVNGQTLLFNTSWIWVIDRYSYDSDTDPYVFHSNLELGTYCNSDLSASIKNQIAQPFEAWEINAPIVDGVTPSAVSRGDTFTIGGNYFYPSLVEDVLLEGTPLDSANWDVGSDEKISVTAPSDPPAFNQALSVEVKTSGGYSNNDQTVTISDQ